MRSAKFMAATLLCGVFALAFAVEASAQPTDIYKNGARYIHEWNRALTDIMIDDGWTPPIATRHYANANVAAYQAALPGFPECRSLEGQLNGLKDLPKPDLSKPYDWRVAAIAAYRVIATDRLFRSQRADSVYRAQIAEINAAGAAADVVERSAKYGESVGMAVRDWMRGDGYIKITAISRYVIPKGRGLWEPTEPDFKDPADPFWGTMMRTMALPKSDFIPCDGPNRFDTERKSAFYKEAHDVYEMGRNLTDEQQLIANYWNDNPVVTRHRGHIVYTERWMTPPGHWINITGVTARMKDLGMMQALETYTLVSIAMYDGFISCWHEKYRSNVIRPVTYIHRYFDSTWRPFIQTPPFPEHTSGHSTISAAAATVLTKLLGEFEFTDNTSTPLGLPTRTFKTFMNAAEEAGMSRLYGGIHYMRANLGGRKNGIAVAEYVLRMVRTRV